MCGGGVRGQLVGLRLSYVRLWVQSDHQVRQQVPLPTKPSHWPLILFFETAYVIESSLRFTTLPKVALNQAPPFSASLVLGLLSQATIKGGSLVLNPTSYSQVQACFLPGPHLASLCNMNHRGLCFQTQVGRQLAQHFSEYTRLRESWLQWRCSWKDVSEPWKLSWIPVGCRA